jgi:hypothetical protein
VLAGAALVAVAAWGGRWSALRDRWLIAFLCNVATGAATVLTGWFLFAIVRPIDPTVIALGAVMWVTAGFAAVVLGTAAFWATINALRKLAGRVQAGQALPDFNLATLAFAGAAMAAATALAAILGRFGGAA